MKFSINAYITVEAAARLLITANLDLLCKWTDKQAKRVLNELLNIKMDDIINIIDADSKVHIHEINSSNIPQFGKIETVICVPNVIIEDKITNLDYVQMGFYLKKDPNASMLSNQKFGENHGKIAAQLGLINCIEQRFFPSTITEVFINSYTIEEQRKIVNRLFVRIPIVKILLQESKYRIVNGYDYMIGLTHSTQERRGSSLRTIFEAMNDEDSKVMKERIKNIVWKK